MIIAHRESFTKSSVFKMFSFHTKPPVWRAFTKSSFFVTDSLTEWPYHRNKVVKTEAIILMTFFYLSCLLSCRRDLLRRTHFLGRAVRR